MTGELPNPENIEVRLSTLIDEAANAPEEISDEITIMFAAIANRIKANRPNPTELVEPEEIIVDAMMGKMAELFAPGGHIDPTLDQRARSIDALQSDWIEVLTMVDDDERSVSIGEMALEAATEGNKPHLSVLKALLNVDKLVWEYYIPSALEEGPESRVWDTTHWLIANQIAREEA